MYHERNRSAGRMPGQVKLRFMYRGAVGDWFDLLMVTPTEMAELAEKTGWRVSETFGAPDAGYLRVYVLRKA